MIVVAQPFLTIRTVSLPKVTAEATSTVSSLLPPSPFSAHLSKEKQDAWLRGKVAVVASNSIGEYRVFAFD